MRKVLEKKAATGRSLKLRTAIGMFSLVLFAIGGSACLVGKKLESASTAAVASENTRRLEIAVDGMTCSSCAAGVRSMLKRTDGVTYAEASYKRKEAIVKYDPARTDEKKILAAITSFGYGAEIK